MTTDQNTLYYGDNLDILRRYIADESVDLIYLDPPFNSNANYNVLFKGKSGQDSAAQIEAFGDTWHWDQVSAATFDEVVTGGGTAAAALVAFQKLLGNNDMLAYLAMMAARIEELRRVLKPTGSIYLHCDPTASHYLKVLMDAVFGAGGFRNEIVWRRDAAGKGAKRGSNQWPRNADVILLYSKGERWQFQQQHIDLTKQQATAYRYVEPGSGRKYKAVQLGDYSAASISRMETEGLIHVSGPGKKYKKYYLDEAKGTLDTIWTDIPGFGTRTASPERLGYPTQKPVALLERIIEASSNPGDLVLDPFCGCGTTVTAAQKLGRRWIGIDITHLAIGLMRKRLTDSFGEDLDFDVIGEPTTEEDAAELATSDPYQFQWWALGLIGARPVDQKKGADKGIDGLLYFIDDPKGRPKSIIISVKAGKLHAPYVRDLRGVIDREEAVIGVLLTFNEPTAPMRAEAASAGFYTSPGWNTKHPRLQIMTVGELLDGRRIDMPAPMQTNVTHERAQRSKGQAKQSRLGL